MNIWRLAIDEKSGAALGEPEAVTTIGGVLPARPVNVFTTTTAFAVVNLWTHGWAATPRLTARG